MVLFLFFEYKLSIFVFISHKIKSQKKKVNIELAAVSMEEKCDNLKIKCSLLQ